jgi:hypothetical protein
MHPIDPLGELTGLLAAEPLLAPHVERPADASAALGGLAAAGDRARAEPAAYALIVEAVREGYLLHYGRSRLLVAIEPDLALLAGDHLYALGLDRLATVGDLGAVRELSDLISLAAQVHDGERPAARAEHEAKALWLAAATAIAAGASDAHDAAKAMLRAGSREAAAALHRAALDSAAASGIRHELEDAAEAIDFASEPPPELG